MRVLYESLLVDPTTPSQTRGPSHVMCQVLRRADVELRVLGPPAASPWRLETLARKVYRRLTGRRYLRFPLTQAARHGARLEAEVKAWKPDVVLTMFPAALYRYSARAPVVYRVDATYRSMIREYPEYGYSRFMTHMAAHLQARACHRSSLLVTHSTWSRSCLESEYRVPGHKIRVFANVAGLPPAAVPADHGGRGVGDPRTFRLLFVGGDRRRKGLDVALDVVRRLNQAGRETRLTVCGIAGEDTAHARFVGPYDQSIADELQAYVRLYRNSHLLLHPTRFDPWAMVTSEAAAFAVPTLTNAVAGGSSSVLDGETGVVLPKHSDARTYAAAIIRLMDDPERLARLGRGARERYERELSWDRFGDNLVAVLREAARARRSEPCA